MINVLISLFKGYGLGDAVQMSAVLRHLRKHRPDWSIDFQAEPGRETVGYGIVRNVFCYGDPYPSPHYDLEAQIVLYDTFANWHDRPNTRVTSCLHERFGIPWDPSCGRYEINVPTEVRDVVRVAMRSVTRPVAFHYQGDSAKEKKDLTPEQATRICAHIKSLGCTPIVLDWRNNPPLGLTNGHSVAMNCAVISECEAFVGIDSGPSKCASATNTPTLVTWTGHHPAPFHDPAPNTEHLVPVGYHGLAPVCNDLGVIRWFEEHHTVSYYTTDPVERITKWLSEILG